MVHPFRLYFMIIDILTDRTITTYREEEHEILMDIRNGKWLENNKPSNDYMNFIRNYNRVIPFLLKEKSNLSEDLNLCNIDDYVIAVHEKIVKGEI